MNQERVKTILSNFGLKPFNEYRSNHISEIEKLTTLNDVLFDTKIDTSTNGKFIESHIFSFMVRKNIKIGVYSVDLSDDGLANRKPFRSDTKILGLLQSVDDLSLIIEQWLSIIRKSKHISYVCENGEVFGRKQDAYTYSRQNIYKKSPVKTIPWETEPTKKIFQGVIVHRVKSVVFGETFNKQWYLQRGE